MNTILMLVRAIATTEFRPLTPEERQLYEGAADDAVIGLSPNAGLLAEVLCCHTGGPIATDEGCEPQVIVSGDAIQVHGTTPDHECVHITLEVY